MMNDSTLPVFLCLALGRPCDVIDKMVCALTSPSKDNLQRVC
jgi:hypothetical protein